MGQPVGTVGEQNSASRSSLSTSRTCSRSTRPAHQRTAIVHRDEAPTVEVAAVARNDEAVANEVAAAVHSRCRRRAERRTVQDVEEAEFARVPIESRMAQSRPQFSGQSVSFRLGCQVGETWIWVTPTSSLTQNPEPARLAPVDELVVGEPQLRGGTQAAVVMDAVGVRQREALPDEGSGAERELIGVVPRRHQMADRRQLGGNGRRTACGRSRSRTWPGSSALIQLQSSPIGEARLVTDFDTCCVIP